MFNRKAEDLNVVTQSPIVEDPHLFSSVAEGVEMVNEVIERLQQGESYRKSLIWDLRISMVPLFTLKTFASLTPPLVLTSYKYINLANDRGENCDLQVLPVSYAPHPVTPVIFALTDYGEWIVVKGENPSGEEEWDAEKVQGESFYVWNPQVEMGELSTHRILDRIALIGRNLANYVEEVSRLSQEIDRLQEEVENL